MCVWGLISKYSNLAIHLELILRNRYALTCFQYLLLTKRIMNSLVVCEIAVRLWDKGFEV